MADVVVSSSPTLKPESEFDVIAPCKQFTPSPCRLSPQHSPINHDASPLSSSPRPSSPPYPTSPSPTAALRISVSSHFNVPIPSHPISSSPPLSSRSRLSTNQMSDGQLEYHVHRHSRSPPTNPNSARLSTSPLPSFVLPPSFVSSSSSCPSSSPSASSFPSPSISCPPDASLKRDSSTIDVSRFRQPSITECELDEPQTHAFISEICRASVPGWSALSDSDVCVRILTGGLTNKLYTCSRVENSPQDTLTSTVVVRIYGAGACFFFSRAEESAIFACLAKCKVGPALVADFRGPPAGRIEGFLRGRTLVVEDLPTVSIYREVARVFAHMHVTGTKCLRENYPRMIHSQPSLFVNMRKWVSHARTVTFDPVTESAKHKMLQQLWDGGLQEESEFLEDYVTNRLAKQYTLNVCFCHNDLQEGNLMLSPDGNELHAIDFEYGSWNYQLYDVANHFAEWMYRYDNPDFPGFGYDPKKYPPKEVQRDFFRHYLRAVERYQREDTCGVGCRCCEERRRRSLEQREERREKNAVKETVGKEEEKKAERGHDESEKRESERQRQAVHELVSETAKSVQKVKEEKTETERGNEKNRVDEGEKEKKSEEAEIDDLIRLTDIFTLGSDLLWCAWSIIQARTSTIEFGYMEYGKARLDEYHRMKKVLGL